MQQRKSKDEAACRLINYNQQTASSFRRIFFKKKRNAYFGTLMRTSCMWAPSFLALRLSACSWLPDLNPQTNIEDDSNVDRTQAARQGRVFTQLLHSLFLSRSLALRSDFSEPRMFLGEQPYGRTLTSCGLDGREGKPSVNAGGLNQNIFYNSCSANGFLLHMRCLQSY